MQRDLRSSYRFNILQQGRPTYSTCHFTFPLPGCASGLFSGPPQFKRHPRVFFSRQQVEGWHRWLKLLVQITGDPLRFGIFCPIVNDRQRRAMRKTRVFTGAHRKMIACRTSNNVIEHLHATHRNTHQDCGGGPRNCTQLSQLRISQLVFQRDRGSQSRNASPLTSSVELESVSEELSMGIVLATCLEAPTIRAVLYSILHCRTNS
ncbi:hypothetical protein B0H14DRAFT_2826426, partial [Mycena olivaceomarginata]